MTKLSHYSMCDLYTTPGDRYVKCPYCGDLSHRDHLLEWIKVEGYSRTADRD